MSKDEVLQILNKRDKLELIYSYCIDMGKNELSTSQFIKTLLIISLAIKEYCYNYALQYYVDKYNIILLYDKNNRFIKAF